MRVCHVVPALFANDGVFGGAERYALELARAMAKRVPTTLLAFGSRTFETTMGELRVQVLRNWTNFRRLRFDPVNPQLFRHLRTASVIHYHQPYTMMGSAALLYARASGKPVFSNHHGGGGFSLQGLFDIDSWYDGHLHVSEFSRRQFGHGGLRSARVILGGVDVERFSPDPSVERTGEVLFVGRLLPHKGVNYLVEAVDATTPLTIIGRRWTHALPFYELLRELSEGKSVTIQEEADDDTVLHAYRRALCIVLPSVTRSVFGHSHPIAELLGQTLLEGMACGTPAICTSVCSMPEVVEDGVTGFVVPPNDPQALGERIRWLREHPLEARRMGAAARQRVLEHFSWDRVVDRCFRAYGFEPPAA